MNKRLRIIRQPSQPSKEIVHDANDVLKTNPLSGEGVPSSYPAFEDMMHSYFGGRKIRLEPYDRNLKYLADEVDENDPPEPAHKWRDSL